MSTQCFPYRPYDYMYDPIFSVSGPTDHYKEAVKCKITTAKFQICPIFPNMFSDLQNYPRQRLVRRRSNSIPMYIQPETKPKISKESLEVISATVLGKDKCKFFKFPITNFPPRDILPYRTIAPFHIKKLPKKNEGKTKINVASNTVFSNSAAQTEPWEPPYKVMDEEKGEPEVLLLNFLKWGEGLPAGEHEIELIERARMKRAWEKSIKPNVADEKSMIQLKEYLEALELDEWAFREKEIQEIQDLRMELLQNMLLEVHEKTKKRSQDKLTSIIERTMAEKNRKLEKLRREGNRNLRKLDLSARGINQRYHKVDIIDEHVDFKSEIYAPMLRHGEHPKRWHKVIDETNKKYKAQFIGVENISTLPTWLEHATKVTEREIDRKLPIRHICMRETKWTQPVLKELHEELKSMRDTEERKSCKLLRKKEVEEALQYTCEVEAIPEEIESQYQAIVRLQSTIRGRATQVLIYEGRDRCRKLIETLRTSVGLLQAQKDEKLKTKLKVKGQQRQEVLKEFKIEQVKETLERLRGSSVGTLLDFLNKELRRLQCERRAHALCMSLERDLHTREAAEAGRRQRELRRRREHDEIFKQVVKIHQETVDMYLQNIIVEGMDFASQDEASMYIKDMGNKIDMETEELYQLSSSIETEDEVVADMIHHFLLEETQKEVVRNNIISKQRLDLKTIHEEVFGTTENLPKIDFKGESASIIVRPIVRDVCEKAMDIVDTGNYDFIKSEIIEPLIDGVVHEEDEESFHDPVQTEDEESVPQTTKIQKQLVLQYEEPQEIVSQEKLYEEVWPQYLDTDSNVEQSLPEETQPLTPRVSAYSEQVTTEEMEDFSTENKIEKFPFEMEEDEYTSEIRG